MKKFLLSAVLAAPFFVNSVAKAQDDASTPTKKPMKHSKKQDHDMKHGHGMKMNPDGTAPDKAGTKTDKPVDPSTP